MTIGKTKSELGIKLLEHKSLVTRLANRMMAKLPASISVDDLVQAGMIGLMDAIQRHEQEQEVPFEAYAAMRIRGAMLDELRNNDWLPRGLRQTHKQADAAKNILKHQLGRSPTELEVAGQLGIPLAEYQRTRADGHDSQVLNFEDFYDPDTKESFLDRHCVDEASDPLLKMLDLTARQAVTKAIKLLPVRERKLMAQYYDKDYNLKQIGASLGVTESRVSQLHSQVVRQLRATMREQAWSRQH